MNSLKGSWIESIRPFPSTTVSYNFFLAHICDIFHQAPAIKNITNTSMMHPRYPLLSSEKQPLHEQDLLSLHPGHLFPRFPFKSVSRPFRHRLRSQSQIKIYAWLVPVQTPPFQTAAAPLDRYSRQLAKRGFTVSPPTILRHDIQIFQIYPCTA